MYVGRGLDELVDANGWKKVQWIEWIVFLILNNLIVSTHT